MSLERPIVQGCPILLLNRFPENRESRCVVPIFRSTDTQSVDTASPRRSDQEIAAAKTEVIGENENAMFTSAGDQGPVQAVERDYPFSMRSRISAWLMESSPSRSSVSPSA